MTDTSNSPLKHSNVDEQLLEKIKHWDIQALHSAASSDSTSMANSSASTSSSSGSYKTVASLQSEDDALPTSGIKTSTRTVHELDWEVMRGLVQARLSHLLAVQEAKQFHVDTQTFVTQLQKKFISGCVNCRGKDHKLKECTKDLALGFCAQCGAIGFDSDDCIFAHGVESELALGRCDGCSEDLSLYTPECIECNKRNSHIIPWLRSHYALCETKYVPVDHRWLIGESDSVLRKVRKKRFDSRDTYKVVREAVSARGDLQKSPNDDIVAARITKYRKTSKDLEETKRLATVEIGSYSRSTPQKFAEMLRKL